MMSGADPSLLQKLAQIRAESAQAAAEIDEEVRATEAEVIESNREIEEENRRLSEELDEQAEQRRAENAGETTGGHRSSSAASEEPERRFGFADDEEFREGPQQHSAPVVPSRPRHRRASEPDLDDDDEDFSKTSWIN